MYCTYLTVYSGNKLPPFYIGHSTITKVENGYHGSVSSKEYKSIWQKELRNNPRLFRTKILTVHNTRLEASEKERYFQDFFDVANNPMYINRSISNIKFYCSGHSLETRIKISEAGKNRKASNETKLKMSMAKLGKTNSMEHRKRQSLSRMGIVFSDDTKRKISISKTGTKHTEETKNKMSISRCKKVSDGIRIYNSVREAAKEHSIHYTTVSNRAKKGIDNWFFVNNDK